MRLFAIGDLHLSGTPPTKPMTIFGPAWKNHWQRIKTDWRNKVSNNDLVLVAGDISWALRAEQAKADLDEIVSLPGKKILIRGNHDYWWDSVSKLTRLMDNRLTFIQNDCVPVTDDIAVCGTRGWICPGDIHFTEKDNVPYRREVLRVTRILEKATTMGCKTKILLLHHPPFYDVTRSTEFTDLLATYNVTTCIFGHLHGIEQNRLFPCRLGNTILQLVSADYVHCELQEIILSQSNLLPIMHAKEADL